ncbi:MAG: UDP-N-acetylmuramoyl-L-alanyl-D-glutamate--2,6-diaminopimelate ligase [Rickettsiales bacterium]|nr:UDP-N-acetylmuramoyl-L-alanyl-D-glutamate--2,6-diaminopimelate ligase [Rickettsiales bacterium]
MNKNDIRTSTKHVAAGDVFFCCLKAEQFLNADVLEKASEVYVESGFFDRNGGFADYKNKIIETANFNQDLLAALKKTYQIPSTVMAITGTKGKTSTSWFVMQILGLCGIKCGYVGTIGAYIFDGTTCKKLNTEDTLTTPAIDDLYRFFDEMAQQNVQHVIFEASSHALEQSRFGDMRVNVAAFTNLSQDHLDYHKTMDNYFNAKTLLFKQHQVAGDVAILNTDDSNFDKLKSICEDKKISTFEAGGYGKDIKILSTSQHVDGQDVELEVCGNKFAFRTDILGNFQVKNLSMAMAFAINCGVSVDKILSVVSAIKAPLGRMQRVANEHIFVDYAHTPKSLEESLKLLKTLYEKVIVVFGCGGNRDKQKRPLMFEVANLLADEVVVTSDNPRFEVPSEIIKDITCFHFDKENPLRSDQFVLDEMAKLHERYAKTAGKVVVIEDRRDAIKFAVNEYYCMKNDTKIGLLIAGKGHENYQILGNKKHHFDDVEEVESALK